MPSRSRAREVALQALHHMEFNPEAEAADRARFLKGRLHSGRLVAYAESLIDGVSRHRPALDARLDAKSEHWRISRMAATDRNVLRLALHELMHTETPGPVVVDEAIELARRYGSANSPRFVAGILGGLLAELRGAGGAA